jgi:sec-independent protein translocase protein TatC
MSEPGSEKLAEGTLISHLLELRDRLIRAVIGVVIVFVPAAIYRNRLFEFMSEPMKRQLPPDSSLIATGVMSTFTVPFKLAFFISLFVAMPWVLYQIWSFVAPGLYKKEKRFAVPLLVSSILLFYVGIYFAYEFVFPMAFKFFTSSSPEGVKMMTDITNYMDFALRMFLAFGVAFEIPVVVVLLTLTGLVPVEKLSGARGYVVIAIFVVAAVLTPPDPLSQILMAVPMWLLYESGVLMAKLLARNRAKDEASASEDAQSGT